MQQSGVGKPLLQELFLQCRCLQKCAQGMIPDQPACELHGLGKSFCQQVGDIFPEHRVSLSLLIMKV